MPFRSGKSKVGKVRSRSSRAGLSFPVGRITRSLRRSLPHVRLGSAAPVYMAAVLEYLTVEILDLSGSAAKSDRKARIKPRHIRLATGNDPEITKLLGTVTISEGGELPHIHKELVPAPKSTGAAKQKFKVIKKVKRTPKIMPKSKKKNITMFANVAATSAKVTSADVGGSSTPGKQLPVLSEGTLFLGQKLTVVKGDITQQSVDCIVHPTDGSFSTSGQVGSVLQRAGGLELATTLSTLRSQPIPKTGVAISDMFNIDCKKLIHCNSPSWSSSSGVADMEKTIMNCLKLADKEGIKSIALPSVGSGNAGWPKQLAAETILRTINRYFQGIMASSIKQVYFVLYDSESVEVYTTELKRLIDSLT